MSSSLKINRLDSPLARATPPVEPLSPTPEAVPSTQRAPRAAAPPTPTRLSSAAPRPATAITTASALDALPEPPALTETLELISSRLPVSLRRSLTDLTGALRARNGERVSQKSLPEQEVLAALIWAAGSAADPQAVSGLEQTLSAYRARRYAAAAAALRPS